MEETTDFENAVVHTIPKVTLQRRLGREGLRRNSCNGLNSGTKPQLIFCG